MKKKLFLALLTTLLLLLAATTALAVSPSDYNCLVCGEPCTKWFQHRTTDGSMSVHSPYCSDCGVLTEAAMSPCTPVEGTATCMDAALCSVCGSPDWIGSAPDPNAHDICEWQYYSSTQHYRYCLDCFAEASFEYEDHYGGTATCNVKAVCEGCGDPYGEYALDDHDWGDWEGFSASTHIRVCLDCDAEEEAPHTGGDGACWTTCGECGWNYSNPNGQHRNLSEWYPYSMTQHYRECLDCVGAKYSEYGEHTGGTATCNSLARCETCNGPHGDFDDTCHVNMTDWEPYSPEQHYRVCADCYAPDSYEYEVHHGGDGSCMPFCEGCGLQYYNENGTHNTMTAWQMENNELHSRQCEDCYQYSEQAAHHGGDGSCRPTCEDCGKLYSDLNGEHRNMSDWWPESAAQHVRRCLDCHELSSYEYADHTGGDDTCQPHCKDCGAQYTNKSGKHLYMSTWVAISDTQHSRYCLDCFTYEYADHTGSDGTCRPACEVCGSRYPDLNGQHLHMSVWEGVSDTQHIRICTDCYRDESIEYGSHSGGTATCINQAICEDCTIAYGRPDNTRHGTYSSWTYHNENQHSRYCRDCSDPSSIVYEDHYGGTATCNTPAICEGCGDPYGEVDPANHFGMTDWVPYSYEQHYRACMGCASPDSYEFEDHSGGTATCTENGVCQVCKAAYIPVLQHAWSEWKPGVNGTHSRTCTINAEHTETADCEWSDWTHLTHIHHERRCAVCNGQELGEHTGGTATCSSPRICDICGDGYGSPDYSGLSGHPNPVIEYKPGTCYDKGYYRVTCNEPGCSAPFTELIYPAIGQHIYHRWQSAGDGSHISACRVCGEKHTVPCILFRTAEKMTPSFAACPICGAYEGGVLPVIHSYSDKEILLYGTLVIRGGVNPADGVLYAITVVGSYGGNVIELNAPVTVRIPVDAADFRVVDMNGQEIPFILEKGVLSFETAKAGLFLLIPNE